VTPAEVISGTESGNRRNLKSNRKRRDKKKLASKKGHFLQTRENIGRCVRSTTILLYHGMVGGSIFFSEEAGGHLWLSDKKTKYRLL
jgi:hypothetical protein